MTKEPTKAIREVWRYLAVEHAPRPCDVIFVFGGIDLAVPAKAAELYSRGIAPVILISGGEGALTRQHFSDPEALVFQKHMINSGVPASAIVVETKAAHTGENVSFGMAALEQRGVHVGSAALVAKPFLMRRCLATFKRQFPEVSVVACPPSGEFDSFVDRHRAVFIHRLVAELDRISAYREKGFIELEDIPASVHAAEEAIRRWFASLSMQDRGEG